MTYTFLLPNMIFSIPPLCLCVAPAHQLDIQAVEGTAAAQTAELARAAFLGSWGWSRHWGKKSI